MKAGGHSQKNKNPSRAAASVQPTRPLCVILVEPRDLVRDCVAICLRVADPGLTVLQYSSVYEVDSEGPDCVALVLSFLSASRDIRDLAVEVSRAKDQLPDVPVVVIAEGDELSFVRMVIGSGVRGYIPTSFDFAMFKEAIQFVAAGGTFVPASVLRRGENGQMSDVDEADDVVKHGSNEKNHQNSNEIQERRVAASFTPRELAVISRLRDGKSNKLIARELTITEGTVKLYVRRIMKKLGVENRTQAALVATNMHLAE